MAEYDLSLMDFGPVEDPNFYTGGDTGTPTFSTPYPTAVNQPAGNSGLIGGASAFEWTKLFGGLATSVANAVNGTPPASYYRDPRTGSVLPVGGYLPAGQMPVQRPLSVQPGNLMPLLLFAGLVFALKR